MGTTSRPVEPVTVQWAFVVGVDDYGQLHMIDHEFVSEVRAKRLAVLDDIYAASFVASKEKIFAFHRPSTDAYTVAFLVAQMPNGFIAPSMDIFDNIIPVSSPSNTQVMGAFGVLQGHIIAQRAADMAAQVAVQATLSVLTNATENVQAADPEAAKKTKGGLYVV